MIPMSSGASTHGRALRTPCGKSVKTRHLLVPLLKGTNNFPSMSRASRILIGSDCILLAVWCPRCEPTCTCGACASSTS